MSRKKSETDVTPAKAGVQKGLVKYYYVYILASRKNGTLYIGVANNLIKRAYEHKDDLVESFTRKYKVHKLVYYEQHNDIGKAITREKQMKKWKRLWKIELIEKSNPQWKDLYCHMID